MRYLAYTRVSTPRQGKGVSLKVQKRSIQEYAARHGLTISKWFMEKRSAATSGRIAFSKMVDELNKRKAEGLLVHKVDRSMRNLEDWVEIRALSDAGYDVHFVTEALDFRSRGGRLAADIQAVVAADFTENNRQEVIKGQRGRLDQGLYPFRAPVGYLDTGKGKPKKIDPVKGPLVRELFHAYATGKHSLRSLYPEIERLGLTSRTDGTITFSGFAKMLRNPFYIGIIEIRKTGMTYNGIHEPLIDTATFNAVQRVKEGRSGPKLTRHNHPWQGVFRCGLCDDPMCPELQKQRYLYYRCHATNCPNKTIRQEQLDAEIVRNLASLVPEQKSAAAIQQDWEKGLAQDRSADQMQSLKLRLKACRRRQSKLTDLLLDEVLSAPEYHAKLKSLRVEEKDLEQQIAEMPDLALETRLHKKFLELVTNLTGLYILLTPAEKRIFVQNVWSNCTVIGKEAHFKPRNWVRMDKNAFGVSLGADSRYTDRNFLRVLELSEQVANRNQPSDIEDEKRQPKAKSVSRTSKATSLSETGAPPYLLNSIG